MANAEIVRLADDAPREKVVAAINALADAQLGNTGARVLMVGHDGTSTDPNLGTATGSGLYQAVIRSAGGTHLQVRNSSDTIDMLAINDTNATMPALVVATSINSQGNTTLGTSSAQTLTVNATTTFASPVTGNGTVQFKTPQVAVISSALTLTTSAAAIAGCSLNLTPGAWLVIGVFYFAASGAGDINAIALGTLSMSGGAATINDAVSAAALVLETAVSQATVSQCWIVTVTATTTITLQARKNAGTGASTVAVPYTTITATNA